MFTHLETFKFHISQFLGKDKLDLIKINITGAKVKIVVSPEKPDVLVIMLRRDMLHYDKL